MFAWFTTRIYSSNNYSINCSDFPIIHLGDPSPPSKSDKTLYTGIYLPTFREDTNFIIKLLVLCLGALYGPKGEPPLVFIMVFILVFICQPFWTFPLEKKFPPSPVVAVATNIRYEGDVGKFELRNQESQFFSRCRVLGAWVDDMEQFLIHFYSAYTYRWMLK